MVRYTRQEVQSALAECKSGSIIKALAILLPKYESLKMNFDIMEKELKSGNSLNDPDFWVDLAIMKLVKLSTDEMVVPNFDRIRDIAEYALQTAYELDIKLEK